MDVKRREGAPRFAGLEGLRGVAATAVVVSHVLVASTPALSSQFFGPAQPLTGAAWLFTRTPAVILWAGQEWVVVFFVLSGLVLSLAAAGGAKFNPLRYYPARLVRLYVPVLATLLFAAAVHEAVDHRRVAGATQWLNNHTAGWSASATAHELTLLFGAGDYYFTSVLWSLRWEVLFSLLLPLFLLAGSRLPGRLVAAASLLVIVAAGGGLGVARYMPAFMLGTVLAFRRDDVGALLSRRVTYAAVLLASPALLTASWWMPDGHASGLAYGMVALGATGLVALGMHPGALERCLSTRAVRSVGRYSFSLYLVHEPIVVAVAFALGARAGPIVLAACALPLVVAATVVFYRCVELPSQRLARGLGAAASAAGDRAVARRRAATGGELADEPAS